MHALDQTAPSCEAEGAPSIIPSSFKEIALDRASKGQAVIQLWPGRRNAVRGTDAWKHGTTDPEQIAKLWDEMPDANIGVVPSLSYPRLLVIDSLRAEHETYAVRTPSGNFHSYLRLPRGEFVRTRDDFRPDASLISSSGYVVAAGSVVDGIKYEVAHDEKLRLAPRPLAEEFRQYEDDLAEDAEAISAPGKREFPRWAPLSTEINRAPPPYIVRGLFYPQTVGLIVAPQQQLKTFLAILLGIHIARGEDIGPHRIREAHPVLFVASEAPATLRGRAKAWEVGNKTDFPRDFIHLTDKIKPASQGGLQQLNDVIADMAAHDKAPAVVFIDTLATFLAGMTENDAGDIGIVYEALRVIGARYNTCFCIVAHTGKDTRLGARGSSAIEFNADFVFKVTTNLGTLATKMVIDKMKDVERGDPLTFSAKAVVIGYEDGDPRSSLWMKYDPHAAVATDDASFTDAWARSVLEATIMSTPEYFTSTKALSGAMAARMFDDDMAEDDPVVVTRAKLLAGWLGNKGHKESGDPRVSKFVRVQGEGRGKAWIWGQPPKDEVEGEA